MIRHNVKPKEAWEIAKKAPLGALMAILQEARKRFTIDYWLVENGWSFFPSVVVLYATVKCNLNCPMCVDDKLKKLGSADEMKFSEIKKIIDRIAPFRPLLYITGGECLLRKNLSKIIKYAKKKGLICSLTSNCTLLTKAKAKELIESGLDRISISIDGPEKIHDQIRGKGMFKKTIQGIRFLQELKKKRGKTLPTIKFSSIISGMSLPYLGEFIKLAKKLDVPEVLLNQLDYKDVKTSQAHIQYFRKKFGVSCFPQGLICNQKRSVVEKKMANMNINEIKMKILDAKKLAKKLGITAYINPAVKTQDMKRYYSSRFLPQSYCKNPWFTAKILSNGDLITCFNFPIGNLKKQDLFCLWNGKKFRLFRKTLRKKKYFPGCIRCCSLEV